MHSKKKILEKYKHDINNYLLNKLKLELHPHKSKIVPLGNGINLLGYRAYYYHKLLRRSNIRKFKRKFNEKLKLHYQQFLSYEDFIQSLQGWFGYSIWANTYKLRSKIFDAIESIKIKNN